MKSTEMLSFTEGSRLISENDAAKVGPRVVLRLASFGPSPLSREGANDFNHVLHGDKKGRSEHVLTYTGGSYFLDFNNISTEHEDYALGYAVTATEAALLGQQALPAEIVEAWSVPADLKDVSQLLDDGKQVKGVERVTGAAQAISESYRSYFIDAVALEIELSAA